MLFIGNSLYAQNKKRDKEISAAKVLEQVADSLVEKEKYRDALSKYKDAACIFEKNKQWYNSVKTYRQTAWCFLNLNKLDSAQLFNNYSKKLLFKRLKKNSEPELFEESELHYIQARICLEKNEFDSTLHYLNKGLVIINEIKTKSDLYKLTKAKYYQTFGYTNLVTGNYNKSLNFYLKVLELRQNVLEQGHNLLLTSYTNIASVYYVKKDYVKAKEYYWYIIQNCGQKNIIRAAETYNTLGIIRYNTKNYIEAINLYNKALNIYKKEEYKDLNMVSALMNNIGEAYYNLDDFKNAITYLEKSIDIRKTAFGENHESVALSYINIGEYYYRVEKYEIAEIVLLKALEILNKNNTLYNQYINNIYNLLGKTNLKLNNNAVGLNYVQKAICEIVNEFEYNEDLQDPEIFLKGTALLNTKFEIISKPKLYDNLTTKAIANYQIYYSDKTQIDKLKQSFNTYKLALKLLDLIRLDISEDESKFILGEFEKEHYTRAIDICLKLDSIFPEKEYLNYAIEFIDKSKSSALRDKSVITNALKNTKIPNELIERERKLTKELSFYKTQIGKNESDNDMFTKDNYMYNKLALDFDTLCTYFEKTYPRYYKLTHANEFDIELIKANLKQNEIIIEYLVTDKDILIATITNTDFEITKVAIDNSFKDDVLEFHTAIRKVEPTNYFKNNSVLFEKLIAPIQDRINTKTSLLILPDDYLYYIPFEAIFNPISSDTTLNFCNLSYLIKDYDIKYNFSINLWLFNKKLTSNVKIFKSDFIGFAPVFEDEKNLTCVELNKNDTTTRSVVMDGKRYSTLLYSEKEIKEISNLFKNNNQNATSFFYNKASEDNFKNNVANYKYIHISSHGFADKNNPNLSGLVFYHSENSTISDSLNREDGILYSSELSSLDINADLLVLSACETGIGKLVIGEGLIAITRGFVNAGIPNIVYSLWNVADKNTSDLMIGFYMEILTGKTYSEALRKVKLKMIKNTSTSFPKTWSSFMLAGI